MSLRYIPRLSCWSFKIQIMFHCWPCLKIQAEAPLMFSYAKRIQWTNVYPDILSNAMASALARISYQVQNWCGSHSCVFVGVGWMLLNFLVLHYVSFYMLAICSVVEMSCTITPHFQAMSTQAFQTDGLVNCMNENSNGRITEAMGFSWNKT